MQAQSKQETVRLQQQLTDAQRNATSAASAADASIRDLNQQLQAAQTKLKVQQDAQRQACLDQHRQLQDMQQGMDEAQHQLAEAKKQLDAMRQQLLAAEDAKNAAQQRARLAEDQAAAMSGVTPRLRRQHNPVHSVVSNPKIPPEAIPSRCTMHGTWQPVCDPGLPPA
jgi:predicted  nucleic acid-binding Zn-ribbon protein